MPSRSSRGLVCALASSSAAVFCRFGNIARAAIRSLLLLGRRKKSGGAPLQSKSATNVPDCAAATPDEMPSPQSSPLAQGETRTAHYVGKTFGHPAGKLRPKQFVSG